MKQIVCDDTRSKVVKLSRLDTPLGAMVAIGDHKALYLLEFIDKPGLDQQIDKLCTKAKVSVLLGSTDIICTIADELESYFNGTLTKFKTPLCLCGSDFQKLTWQNLTRIPYGKTRSYADQAREIKKPVAYRAVAHAIGVNRIVIVIPCHRVVNSNGNLGGYSGGLIRKRFLLAHEQSYIFK